MYRRDDEGTKQMELSEYMEPFSGTLSQHNRWVEVAHQVDWQALDDDYAAHFHPGGKAAIPARQAVGALVIKKVLGISDNQLLLLVPESPYLQYFLGFRQPTQRAPFSKSSLKAFRRRIPPAQVNEIAKMVEEAGQEWLLWG